jgi:hypothetical protein
MRTSWLIVSLQFSLAACGSLDGMTDPPAQSTPSESRTEWEVVYGFDDRTDVYAHPDTTLRDRARLATVALMSPGAINTFNPNNVTFNVPTLQQASTTVSPAWSASSGVEMGSSTSMRMVTDGAAREPARDCARKGKADRDEGVVKVALRPRR